MIAAFIDTRNHLLSHQGKTKRFLNIINHLNPGSFYWKDPSIPGTNSTEQQYGFIAQDVAKIAANLVATTSPTYLTPDGTYYLNYQGITPLLTKAIQAQQMQINLATTSLSTLTVSQDSFASSTTLTLSSLKAQFDTLSAGQANIQASIVNLQSALASTSLTLSVLASSTANLVSSTSDILATSTSFIARIADAVVALIQTSGQAINSAATWTVGEIHAGLAVFTTVKTSSIETQTASVTNGIEMTDSNTGKIYCVRITDGDFSRTLGSCSSVASPAQGRPASTASTTSAEVYPAPTEATTTPDLVPVETTTPAPTQTPTSTPITPPADEVSATSTGE